MARRQAVKTAQGKIAFARTVTLVYITKANDKWARVPVQFSKRGHVSEAQHDHKGDGVGRYQFRSYRDGKTVYENVPDKWQGAHLVHLGLAEEQRKAVRAAQNGDAVQIGRPKNQTTIATALADYTKAKAEQAAGKGKKRSSTGVASEFAVNLFVKVTGIELVKDITAESIQTFSESLKGEHNTQRRQLKNLRAFVAACLSGDVARYVKNDYSVQANRHGDPFYTAAQEKTAALFRKVIKQEVAPEVEYYTRQQVAEMREMLPENTLPRVAMELYLQTSLRAGEGTNLLWSNVSIEHRTVKTQAIEGQWTSKTGEYRTVRFGKSLSRILKAWKEVCTSSDYVLGTGDGDPQDYNVIREMIQTAVPNIEVSLKKFRSTGACFRLWHGDDPVTVSKMLGHTKNGQISLSGLATTIKYLEANPDRHDVVDKAFGD